uniref:Uncharacterized protein n=1 Tax=Aegilops tauschii subsp. strangulata TaxID=200361 RepID=A0A453JGI5_AEGTS
ALTLSWEKKPCQSRKFLELGLREVLARCWPSWTSHWKKPLHANCKFKFGIIFLCVCVCVCVPRQKL